MNVQWLGVWSSILYRGGIRGLLDAGFDRIFTFPMDESSDYYHSSTSGGKIYRRVFTPRDRPSENLCGGVLLIHGLGDHLGCHEKAARMFCHHGLIAAGLDWPGHGHSTGKRGHAHGVNPLMELIEESLDDLRSRLPADSPIGLYAHSTGAFVLLQFLSEQNPKDKSSLNHPRSFPFIWLSSPLLRPAHGQGNLKIKLSHWLSTLFPGMLFDTGIRVDRCFFPDPETGSFTEDPLKHHKISLALGSDLIKRGHTISECAEVFQSPMKLLITQGSEDSICPEAYAREFFEMVPLSDDEKTFLLLPGVLHEPLKDPYAEDLLLKVGDWVDEALEIQASA